MKLRPPIRPSMLTAALALTTFAHAQVLPPSARGEKRPPPTAQNSTSVVPAGEDLGTPATRRGADIGMTTIPRTDEERRGVKNESAAARAAARKRGPGIAAVDAAAASGAASGVVQAAPASAPLPPQPGQLNPAKTGTSAALRPASSPRR